MNILRTKSEIREIGSSLQKEGKRIGYVPTMGALHNGHLELVKRCVAENDICIVSIFVNPTQFNDKNDLQKYPRTLEADAKLLETVGCHYIFAPEVEQMYDKEELNQLFSFDFGGLDQVMEGKFRPGHFNGVVQVVGKLFNIVQPNKAYFGEKDFQQLAIIRHMVKQLHFPIEIVGCPIVREKSGLALSSRNTLLTKEQHQSATQLSKILFESLKQTNEKTLEETIAWVIEKVNKINNLKVEYFEIVDGNTLKSLKNWEDSNYIVGCITVFCGTIRLIDNIQYKTK